MLPKVPKPPTRNSKKPSRKSSHLTQRNLIMLVRRKINRFRVTQIHQIKSNKSKKRKRKRMERKLRLKKTILTSFCRNVCKSILAKESSRSLFKNLSNKVQNWITITIRSFSSQIVSPVVIILTSNRSIKNLALFSPSRIWQKSRRKADPTLKKSMKTWSRGSWQKKMSRRLTRLKTRSNLRLSRKGRLKFKSGIPTETQK